jgi:hypothetical protein
VFVLSPEILQNYPEVWGDEDDRVADAVRRLTELKKAGIDTIIDPTALGLGRYIPRIARIAQQQIELNIVVATGLYTFDVVPNFFRNRLPGTGPDGSDPMVEMFVRDIVKGIGDTASPRRRVLPQTPKTRTRNRHHHRPTTPPAPTDTHNPLAPTPPPAIITNVAADGRARPHAIGETVAPSRWRATDGQGRLAVAAEIGHDISHDDQGLWPTVLLLLRQQPDEERIEYPLDAIRWGPAAPPTNPSHSPTEEQLGRPRAEGKVSRHAPRDKWVWAGRSLSEIVLQRRRYQCRGGRGARFRSALTFKWHSQFQPSDVAWRRTGADKSNLCRLPCLSVAGSSLTVEEWWGATQADRSTFAADNSVHDDL